MMHKSGRNDTKSPGASVKQDKTLNDYIERKTEWEDLSTGGHKLTFDEWWESHGVGHLLRTTSAKSVAKFAFLAGQENK